MNFHKILYKIGVKLRNPSHKEATTSLNESQWWTREQLDLNSVRQIRKLLVFSYTYSEFYKSLFDSLEFNPNSDFNNLSDISKIPTSSKATLIKHNASIDTTGKYKFNKLFFSETSGSTGQTLTFYKNEEWDSYHRASIARGLGWHGVNVWDKNGYFWGYSFTLLVKFKTMFLDFLMNRYRIFSYSNSEVLSFVNSSRDANYLHGYSSMIYETARIINQKGIKLNNIKLVKATSEKIYEHYQPEIIKAFGTRAVSEYGAAEAGIIAFECKLGKMHVNEETCYVECINDKIVVTNLKSFSFPIIRYELGDYVKLSTSDCQCGRKHQIVEEVLGRVGKSIYGKCGEKYPSLTLYYIFKTLGTEHHLELNYKAFQHEKGLLSIHIEQSLDKEQIKIVNKISTNYFEGNVDVQVYDRKDIHSKSKKLTDFLSTVE